jgi:hypothetical protein
MHTIKAAIARAQIDRAFPGHQLTPGECIELAELLDLNDREGLTGQARERAETLMDRASVATYHGPDERY